MRPCPASIKITRWASFVVKLTTSHKLTRFACSIYHGTSRFPARYQFDLVIGQLETRKKDLLKRIEMNNVWAAQYDRSIGPFEETYDNMTGEIGKTYDNAKAGHKRGLKVLQEEFGYHPAFKRPTDTFTAVPFKPK